MSLHERTIQGPEALKNLIFGQTQVYPYTVDFKTMRDQMWGATVEGLARAGRRG